MIIKSNFGIDEMLNDEALPCKVCINLQKSMVEVLDLEDDITEEYLVIPTVEELYPYNKCMYDFLGDDIVPMGMSASHYLRANQMMREFHVYRRSAVANRLIGWLQAREIELQYESLGCDMRHDCQVQKKNEDVLGEDSKECSPVEKDKKMLTAQLIMESVAEHYGISVVQILSKNRNADIVNARYVTMYLCANMLHMPVDAIGVFIGNRDQSTVIHACKKIADEVENNSQFATEIEAIEEVIHSN